MSRPSRNAARATASASIGSDFPRSRTDLRASAISRGGSLSTVSPRSSKNGSNGRDTCRQSSITHTRSESGNPLAHNNSSPNPSRLAEAVRLATCTPTSSAATAVCVRLCGSVPIVNIPHRPLPLDQQQRPAGGQFSVGAMPRSYQVTPAVLVSCLINPFAVAFDGVEDLVCCLGPHKRLGVFVPAVDPSADLAVELTNGNGVPRGAGAWWSVRRPSVRRG